MREIKFRAWDYVKGCMYYLGEDENVVFSFNSSGIIATDIREDEDEFAMLHHLWYMQYTGLKDKNGKEIYEGDILQDELDEAQAIVIFADGAFYAKWETGGRNSVHMVGGCVEVVGNVHEREATK